ncbi:hypothetical protein [Paracoccus mutanolyticus]|uniref:hypothetical protein n=1 Tax=Paracoccus mutanolyticus TaxID=1499308 RepID=UPI001679B862|nr:hypothetical protein [Paracoccus mutanolyticus]
MSPRCQAAMICGGFMFRIWTCFGSMPQTFSIPTSRWKCEVRRHDADRAGHVAAPLVARRVHTFQSDAAVDVPPVRPQQDNRSSAASCRLRQID